ncbi:pitrilysin family protein [Clostridium sp. ATCC 25772]|uniref:Insulinase family protein n=1 Tax=Clostridium senegalense TaxID=1465809 RepID=A0A6M0H3S5_9CLOT|nr:pitrilysin family protein [Clostridium sp. ATCC 25772]NEU05406.1 insulinase family protein [Clostridium senegalense]
MFDTCDIILENGIRLITIKKETQLASVHVGFNIGALYEVNDKKGIAHFVEHMLFKGTKNRDNEALNYELECLGGEYNAYTDYKCTVYSTTTLNEELNKSLDLLADLTTNSIFPRKQLEKERGVIISEVKSGKDDLEELSFNRINNMAFLKSPLKCDVIGKENHINAMTKEDLIEFYNKYYVPNNCYISIVSNYDHDYIRTLINNYFGDWESKEVNKPIVEFEKNICKKEITYKKEIEQSTVLYLYSFNNLTKEEELALRVLNHKFGESSNSILFRELREDRGLAYDVYTTLDLSEGLKTLYIYTSIAEENVEETLETIDKCIKDITEEKIVFDDETIEIMKKVFKTAVASTLEDVTDLGNYALHQSMEGEPIYEFIEEMEKLSDVTKEDLYKVARKVLKNPTIHILLRDK